MSVFPLSQCDMSFLRHSQRVTVRVCFLLKAECFVWRTIADYYDKSDTNVDVTNAWMWMLD